MALQKWVIEYDSQGETESEIILAESQDDAWAKLGYVIEEAVPNSVKGIYRLLIVPKVVPPLPARLRGNDDPKLPPGRAKKVE